MLLLCGAAGQVAGAQSAGTDPSTFLYDAPQASARAISEQWAEEKKGWTLLDEDDTSHRFRGSAVFINDKVLAVLTAETAQLEVYSRELGGLTLCARLQPLGEGNAELSRTAFKIKENNRGSTSLEVELKLPAGGVGQLVYELSAGAPFIKTTAGPGVAKLRVHAPCQLAVLPDFFGDDMLVDAAMIPLRRTELASENFLLHLLHGGNAILMTVSESRDNDIEATLSEGQPRQIEASDISYGQKPHIWVAILAHKGIWHAHQVSLEDAGKVSKLEWHAPFQALWRVDWTTADQMADSWEMLLQDPGGKYVMLDWFGQDEAQGQRFGKEFGDRDWNKPGRHRWNPVLGGFLFPCWIDQDGQGYLQPLNQRRYTEGGKIVNFAGPAVVYPLDRVKQAPFSTPIESLTIVDLVRMTLGVGPCQYILDLEGQKRNSKGVATCYARDVINALYKEGSQLNHRPVIEEHLDAAVSFIRNVRERIDEYVRFGHDLRAYLDEQKRSHPGQSQFIDQLLEVNSRLDQLFQANQKQIHSPQYAQEAATAFRDKLLTYAEKDAPEKCAAQMAVFTSIGGAQDGLVASCRMIVKTLRQRAGIALALDPNLKEVATEVRSRTQAILRNPTPYEAPRH